MKNRIQESFNKVLSDKPLLALNIGLVVFAILACLAIGFSVGPSDLQLVTHYSAFGATHLYRDQWFYLLTFVLFPLIVCVLHTIIAAKLFILDKRSLSVIFLWAGIAVILLDWAMAKAILNIWIPL